MSQYVVWWFALTYSSWGSQDTKILVGEKSGIPRLKILKRVYWQYTYLLSIIKSLFPEIAELEWQIVQDKKENSFNAHTRTHARTHIRNLEFSVDYGAQPLLLMFKSDSHQVLLCLLFCYALLVHQLFFRFEDFISFHWLLPILIHNCWFMISGTIKIQSWSGNWQNLTG